jgi:CRP-like cAMP-binding protein
LDDSPIFDDLSPATRSELDRLAVEKMFRPGTELFVQGEIARSLFVLLSGRVKVWRTTEDGAAMTLTIFGVGQQFGAIAAALDRPSSFTVTTLDPVRAATWRLDDLRRMMADDPRLAANVLRIVANYAEQLVERLAEVAAVPVEQRLARTLLRLAGYCGNRPRTDELRLSRQELADLVSATLPTVSRIISRWRAEEIVDGRRRGSILLLDPARIAEIAGVDLPTA